MRDYTFLVVTPGVFVRRQVPAFTTYHIISTPPGANVTLKLDNDKTVISRRAGAWLHEDGR